MELQGDPVGLLQILNNIPSLQLPTFQLRAWATKEYIQVSCCF